MLSPAKLFLNKRTKRKGKGKERKEKERKGKERKGMEKKRKERKGEKNQVEEENEIGKRLPKHEQ